MALNLDSLGVDDVLQALDFLCVLFSIEVGDECWTVSILLIGFSHFRFEELVLLFRLLCPELIELGIDLHHIDGVPELVESLHIIFGLH